MATSGKKYTVKLPSPLVPSRYLVLHGVSLYSTTVKIMGSHNPTYLNTYIRRGWITLLKKPHHLLLLLCLVPYFMVKKQFMNRWLFFASRRMAKVQMQGLVFLNHSVMHFVYHPKLPLKEERQRSHRCLCIPRHSFSRQQTVVSGAMSNSLSPSSIHLGRILQTYRTIVVFSLYILLKTLCVVLRVACTIRIMCCS